MLFILELDELINKALEYERKQMAHANIQKMQEHTLIDTKGVITVAVAFKIFWGVLHTLPLDNELR